MKIIVSHDVDHLCLGEHWRDTFIPGLMRRSLRSVLRRELALGTMAQRFAWRLNRIQELHAFNLRNEIPATFFFGMRTGLNLSYHWRAAKKHVSFLRDSSVDIGLHGMAYDDHGRLGEEKRRLEGILEAPVNGIRNHYLRHSNATLPAMESLGFAYDSTCTGLELPSQHGGLTEFPISIMDVQLMKEHPNDLAQWLTESWRRVGEAERKNLPVFVINFHDFYYSNGWPIYKAWYECFVDELRDRQYEFISFRTALDELRF